MDIAACIERLRARDASAYRAAQARQYNASAAYDAAAKAIGDAGKSDYKRLEKAAAAILSPHRINWTMSHWGGGDVDGRDWTTSVHLSGEVWPEPNGGKYNMQMRVHFHFSITPRDGAEFERGFRALKAAADAMREGGL